MSLTVGSLFSGVGGFDLASERAGFDVVWQSEVDGPASRVLEHHWPGRNLGDIHNIKLARYQECHHEQHKPRGEGGQRESIQPAVDILVGGFP